MKNTKGSLSSDGRVRPWNPSFLQALRNVDQAALRAQRTNGGQDRATRVRDQPERRSGLTRSSEKTKERKPAWGPPEPDDGRPRQRCVKAGATRAHITVIAVALRAPCPGSLHHPAGRCMMHSSEADHSPFYQSKMGDTVLRWCDRELSTRHRVSILSSDRGVAVVE